MLDSVASQIQFCAHDLMHSASTTGAGTCADDVDDVHTTRTGTRADDVHAMELNG